jgi:hypothetical protein
MIYEYWQHRVTAAVCAVKLVDGRVVAAVDLPPREVDFGLLEHLPYRAAEAASIEKQRGDFRRIDGRRVA